jgi:hypothetical protein
MTTETTETHSPEEIKALMTRVRLGNIKLWQAYMQIRRVTAEGKESDPDLKEALMEEWSGKVRLLGALCTQLRVWGYKDCLYLNDAGQKSIKCEFNLDSPLWMCQVCPSDKPYWNMEMPPGVLPPPAGAIPVKTEAPKLL